MQAGREAGWENGLPPGIKAEQWPRSRTSGLPLVHGFTVRVPEGFRAKGEERIALSYFHPGDSESYPGKAGAQDRVKSVLQGGKLEKTEKGHPFWEALAAHAKASHPATVLHRDILDHDHAIVWHTAAEFAGARCQRPVSDLPDGIDQRAMHLDSPVAKEQRLSFAKSKPKAILIQFGWPLHPVQCSEDELKEQGFGPMVLEIETDVGGANYGDGNCQIDLANGLLDWACT